MLSSWTLRELQRRTKSHHADVDLVQLQLLGRVDTLESYRRHLTRLYGFHRPLQSFFASDPELGPCGLASPTRLVPLRDDLVSLGAAPSDLASLRGCTLATAAADTPRLLGWFFVAERMGLLSTLILRKLKRRLANDLYERSTAYMSACSSQAATRWLQLGALLDRRAAIPGMLDRIEAGAHEAFKTQRQWFGSFRSLATARAS
jgi:heme oxygenase